MYQKLLNKYGYIDSKSGKDEDGNIVIVSIDEELASIRTFQSNGWIRINIYHKDGTNEELYER